MMILRITPEYHGSDCISCGCASMDGIKVDQITTGQIVNEMNEWELYQLGLVRVKPELLDKMSKMAMDTLKVYGWAHTKSCKDRAEKKVLEQKFYILNENGKIYSSYDPKFAELDLDNLTDGNIDALVNGAKIVQVVTTKSVLSDKDYERYRKKKLDKEVAAAKKKQTKETREASKKKKEIEKAKQLLIEVGELKE